MTIPAAEPTVTPNAVIPSPSTRRWLNAALSGLLFLAGLASLFLVAFPEVALGTDVPARAIAFVTTAVTWTASVFGLAVTIPNIPRR